MSILDNYYGEGKSIRDKIKELEEENKKLKEENKTQKEYYIISCEKVYKLEEENKKLKESLDIATKCSSKEEDGIIRLSEENKKLKNKIKKWKNIREIIDDCVMLSFFCFMGAGMLCMLFQMIVDVIMGFQFVRFA